MDIVNTWKNIVSNDLYGKLYKELSNKEKKTVRIELNRIFPKDKQYKE